MRKVHGAAAICGFEDRLARDGLNAQEDVGRATSLVFVILALEPPGLGGQRCARVFDELFARFIDAHLRVRRVMRTLIDFEYVFHGVHEGRALLRWDAEALHPPRFELVFFPTVDGRWSG